MVRTAVIVKSKIKTYEKSQQQGIFFLKPVPYIVSPIVNKRTGDLQFNTKKLIVFN